MTENLLAGSMILKISDFIRDYYGEYGFAPTYREIGSAVGVKSTETIHRLVHIMMDDGVVTQVRGKPRTLRLVDNDSNGTIGPGGRTKR